MKAITVSNFRSNLKHYLDLVTDSLEVLIIPRNNDEEDSIVIMSAKEYNSLVETNYLLQSEANRERLRQSIKQVEAGNLIPFDIDGNLDSK
ncbi:MAG TPA: type II toxin-antitoxin system prevent-host-death family antitoxin [Saprospiraceae bacterium]|nr:type II toxin-antitoxin system Phd/YefM family antitoxin [Saprospiraceae bacterium]MCB9268232.1 type II toxin-antitoxin system Phd/YefM family antitoxin [Lewinellaceae bacterium]HPG06332.1 type II toxin-antitoxin system prevent-host-death family antitoxin [Saprospiraceae bacterium]HRV87596.1 type II toxin-antitoxin system prevent-host-death family antitoxin [Saprospiraceae bacterium]